jgi:hypothetical protein
MDGGNVGIGVSPVSGNQLQIGGGGSPARLQLTNTASGNTAGDGVAFGLDTDGDRFYIWNYDQAETQFAVGGAVALTLNSSQDATFAGEVAIAQSHKLSFDTDKDTYIIGAGANQMDAYVGGTKVLQLTAANFSLEAEGICHLILPMGMLCFI